MPNPLRGTATEERFAASVEVAGINPYVEAPAGIVKALGGGRRIPVLVKVAAGGPTSPSVRIRNTLENDAARLRAIGRLAPGGWFRSTIVPVGSSGSRLYLDKWMRASAGVNPGDRAYIILKLDAKSRELSIPEALRKALNEDAQAKTAWEALLPSRQREILSYLNFLKTPTALKRNIRRTITQILGEDRDS
jgi:hypothetical protein